jgi:hypothetical protein
MKIHGYPLWHYFIAGSHSLAGYLTPLVGVFIGPWLAVLLWVSFWGYEVLEWLYFWWIDKRPDKVHSDVLEYSIPLFTTSIVLLALRAILMAS